MCVLCVCRWWEEPPLSARAGIFSSRRRKRETNEAPPNRTEDMYKNRSSRNRQTEQRPGTLIRIEIDLTLMEISLHCVCVQYDRSAFIQRCVCCPVVVGCPSPLFPVMSNQLCASLRRNHRLSVSDSPSPSRSRGNTRCMHFQQSLRPSPLL